MSVSAVLPGVRRHLERLADAAGGEDYCGRLEQDELPGLPPVAERPGHSVLAAGLVEDQFSDGAFGEDLDACLVVAEFGLVLLLQGDDLLLQGADDLQAGAVTDVRQPWVGVAAEVALADPAILRPVEKRAVGLQFPDPFGGLLRMQLGHPPVVEELAAAHGVGEMHLPTVFGVGVAHRRGATAFGHHRVGLAEQRFAHYRDPQAALPGFDHRTKT